jgi:hypothetical protein
MALGPVADELEGILATLADTVLTPQPAVRRKKLEHLITGMRICICY